MNIEDKPKFSPLKEPNLQKPGSYSFLQIICLHIPHSHLHSIPGNFFPTQHEVSLNSPEFPQTQANQWNQWIVFLYQEPGALKDFLRFLSSLSLISTLYLLLKPVLLPRILAFHKLINQFYFASLISGHPPQKAFCSSFIMLSIPKELVPVFSK